MKAASISKTSWTSEVYPPSEDTFILEDALLNHFKTTEDKYSRICLEIGCGSGYISTTLSSLNNSYVIAIDINTSAMKCSNETFFNHNKNNIELVLCDIMSNSIKFKDGFGFDLIVCNPPYVPSELNELNGYGINRAWAGGINGREFIDKFVEKMNDLLNSGGEAFLVVIDENNPKEIINNIKDKGLKCKNVLRRLEDEEMLNVIYIKKI